MENFEFVSPTHFVFGRGAEEQVGEKLAAAGAKRVLVHFGGGSAVASGLIDRVGASLDAAGIEHLELGGVRPNPEITLVREGVKLCKEAGVDWILAVGGGSVIDSAKAIANGACVEGDVWELFETKATDHDVLPIAVVLTIPAAGSEASKNTVISNDELGRKTGYANNAHRPKFAFMNPELTYSLPAFQTAAPGAADQRGEGLALSHRVGVEGRGVHPLRPVDIIQVPEGGHIGPARLLIGGVALPVDVRNAGDLQPEADAGDRLAPAEPGGVVVQLYQVEALGRHVGQPVLQPGHVEELHGDDLPDQCFSLFHRDDLLSAVKGCPAFGRTGGETGSGPWSPRTPPA